MDIVKGRLLMWVGKNRDARPALRDILDEISHNFNSPTFFVN